ncbi:HAMP domain-containing sensor histidine kinase [Bacteroides sp. GM023]|uniref:tetratricopeptide repeat-containing sensor histidine kinase n=1 Tax=Bacteroides sp. GM023 TaxID=2723058 RepID=UPI00168A82D3|nr:HAMP domain-containing sensor histidine kinase [Bacteroides sp. GM023]MBD3590141.1 HAMP domain-containing histidine kinase [Bacteroides sp. GM023]
MKHKQNRRILVLLFFAAYLFTSVQAHGVNDKAKQLKSPEGRALSLQAIGDSYMHTGIYELAAETFEAAETELENSNDAFLKLRLTIQQIHTYLKMDKVEKAMEYLDKAENLLPQIETEKDDFEYYICSYRTLAYIKMKDKEQVAKYWKEGLDLQKNSKHLSELSLELSINYHLFMEEYTKAIPLYDSLIVTVQRRGNLYEYKNALQSKGALLHTLGDLKGACLLYNKVKTLNQSLNTERFVESLDSIRSTYIADRMELENAEAHDELLLRIIFFSLLVLIIAGALVVVIKRNNKELNKSREKLSETNEKAKRAILSKSMFLSNMTHEIRTPLNAIVGFSEVLSSMGDSIDDETRQMCGESIRQNAQLLHKLINDVMELSKQEESSMSFKLEKHEVVALCRNTIETVERVKRTSAEILFQTPLNELELYTDSIRLQQVLINLLINATKFTSSGTITLLLDVDAENKQAVFTVEDTGCGIPLNKQLAIFSRFEKLHEGIQGSGIGLALCKFIVEHLKGRIWIDPKYTSGARFVFTHPLNNNEPEV